MTEAVQSWGLPEAPTATRLKRREEALEERVSQYIGKLLVTTIEVPGSSSKNNDRAYLEQNLIALLSNMHAPLDPPSHHWLGRCSDKKEIRKSALWNVNHTLQNFDQRFLDMLDYYVLAALGTAPRAKPEAPANWARSVRNDSRQLSFLVSP
ncbi:MAG TPA: hypothetical protein VHY79_12695 [Rhizomicrobium sp.]|jgi:hypothetical protein|nr:hypothetical protein [Rhizomicrobium sp.]